MSLRLPLQRLLPQVPLLLTTYAAEIYTCRITVDREIFARKNLLNFHVVLFSSPRYAGSVASFLLFDVEKYLCF